MNIGANIRRMREDQKMTQAELAGKLNISQPMLCQIERGTKTLSMQLGMELANVLHCKLDDLFA